MDTARKNPWRSKTAALSLVCIGSGLAMIAGIITLPGCKQATNWAVREDAIDSATGEPMPNAGVIDAALEQAGGAASSAATFLPPPWNAVAFALGGAVSLLGGQRFFTAWARRRQTNGTARTAASTA